MSSPQPQDTDSTPPPPDIALFLDWRLGDTRAGAALLQRLRPRLLRFLHRCDPNLAEDVAHDALVSLVAARDTLHDAAALYAYVFTAARRIRARALSRRDVGVDEIDEHCMPPRLVGHLELPRLDVVRLLARHPSRCTDAVVEYYLGGRRAPEIAHDLGVSESTVRSRIRHGLAQLRRSSPS